eukprot:scaffold65940_cov68-Phaeocystis_antarctica.AAC.6
MVLSEVVVEAGEATLTEGRSRCCSPTRSAMSSRVSSKRSSSPTTSNLRSVPRRCSTLSARSGPHRSSAAARPGVGTERACLLCGA